MLRVAVAAALEKAERHQRVEKSRAERDAGPAARGRLESSGPRASSVKTPISIALRSVFEGQNARPVWRILSGFGCPFIRVSTLDTTCQCERYVRRAAVQVSGSALEPRRIMMTAAAGGRNRGIQIRVERMLVSSTIRKYL